MMKPYITKINIAKLIMKDHIEEEKEYYEKVKKKW